MHRAAGHGGMGFIEETGAAQHYRDAKILTIYEGTTAIQANDLIGRKTARDGGATARSLLADRRRQRRRDGPARGSVLNQPRGACNGRNVRWLRRARRR